MLADGLAALHPLFRIGKRFLICGARHSGECGTHRRVGGGERAAEHQLVGFGTDHHIAARNPDLVKKYFALVQGPLAELVERLAPGDPRQIKRYEGDPTASHPLRWIDREIGGGVSRDRPVRHPRRLLSVDYVAVTVQPRDHTAADLGIAKLLAAERQSVGPVRGSVIAQQPISDASLSSTNGLTYSSISF